MDTLVEAGVLSIALTPGAYQASVPVVSGGLIPGDSHTIVVDLVNAGDVPLSSMTLRGVATESGVLDTDTVDGLQLRLDSCSQPWAVAGTGYTCPGTVVPFYAGPILLAHELVGAASLTPGARDHLKATVSLPASAGNALQGQRSSLSFTFTGVQRDGEGR